MPKKPEGLPTNGEAIRAIRLLLDVSMSQLARDAEISSQYLGQLERGNRTHASRRVIKQLAHAMRVDPRALMASPRTAGTGNSEQVAS